MMKHPHIPPILFLLAVAPALPAQEPEDPGPEPVYPSAEIVVSGIEAEGNPPIGAGTVLEGRRKLPPRILSGDEQQALYERRIRMHETGRPDTTALFPISGLRGDRPVPARAAGPVARPASAAGGSARTLLYGGIVILVGAGILAMGRRMRGEPPQSGIRGRRDATRKATAAGRSSERVRVS